MGKRGAVGRKGSMCWWKRGAVEGCDGCNGEERTKKLLAQQRPELKKASQEARY